MGRAMGLQNSVRLLITVRRTIRSESDSVLYVAPRQGKTVGGY